MTDIDKREVNMTDKEKVAELKERLTDSMTDSADMETLVEAFREGQEEYFASMTNDELKQEMIDFGLEYLDEDNLFFTPEEVDA